jgi:hypothetical protein
LILAVKKGGHGFQRRDIYTSGILVPTLVKVHHVEHGRLQSTLCHKSHVPELQLQRELLIEQYWSGQRWIRVGERQQQSWQKLTPEITTGEPDLTASLFVIVRAFGERQTRLRFIGRI